MSINDDPKKGIPSAVLAPEPASGGDEYGWGVDEVRLTQAQRTRRAQLLQANIERDKALAANHFAEWLYTLFLAEKQKDRDQDKPITEEQLALSDNEDFITEMSASLGVNRTQFHETMRKVRSGEMSAQDAVRTTQAAANPANIDMKAAERAVAKYAASGHPLLELIASRESGGNYNIAHNGTAKGMQLNLTGMTVDQVIAWQEQRRKEGAASTACGKYQIICETLKGLKAELAKKGEHIGGKLFNEEMQERLGLALLERRGLKAYLAGRLPEKDFMMNVSKEWAALPKDMGGKSFYQGDKAGNRAHINPAVLLVAMRASKDDGYQSQLQAEFGKGGVAQKASSPGNPSVAFNKGGTDQVAASHLEAAQLISRIRLSSADLAATKKPTLTS